MLTREITSEGEEMTEAPPYHDAPEDAVDPGEPDTRTPRWVKVSAAIALGVIVLLVAMLLLGGGNHGPGRHLGGGDAATGDTRDQARPSEAPEGHEPPSWVPEH